MKRLFIFFILILWAGISIGQEKTQIKEFSSYPEMRAYFGELFQQNKYTEAADLLEKHIERFPDHLEANAYNLAFIYAQTEQYEDGIKTLQYAMDRGIWFNIYGFGAEFWNPYKEFEEFNQIQERNEQLRQEAQKTAKSELLVVTPEDYTPEKKYPLFIALHGGSSNNDNFKKIWHSEIMNSEFIIAYVQSSLLVGMNSYSWTEDMDISLNEIKDAYDKTMEKYSVKSDEIIIGGFSAGGIAAMEVILSNAIPAAGFVVLCPPEPESFNQENIINAKNRGVRGTIITSEMDPRLPVQKKMIDIMKTEGFQYQFIVTPNIGHWFPEDLDKKIDNGISHIRNR